MKLLRRINPPVPSTSQWCMQLMKMNRRKKRFDGETGSDFFDMTREKLRDRKLEVPLVLLLLLTVDQAFRASYDWNLMVLGVIEGLFACLFLACKAESKGKNVLRASCINLTLLGWSGAVLCFVSQTFTQFSVGTSSGDFASTLVAFCILCSFLAGSLNCTLALRIFFQSRQRAGNIAGALTSTLGVAVSLAVIRFFRGVARSTSIHEPYNGGIPQAVYLILLIVAAYWICNAVLRMRSLWDGIFLFLVTLGASWIFGFLSACRIIYEWVNEYMSPWSNFRLGAVYYASEYTTTFMVYRTIWTFISVLLVGFYWRWISSPRSGVLPRPKEVS